MNKNIVRRIIQTVATLLFQGVLLFVSAWSLDWIWAWILIGAGFINLIINAMVLPPEVIEERGRKKENVKKWDKTVTRINFFPLLGIFILSGLDYRFNWSIDLLVPIHILGIVIVISGSLLFTWAMVSNRFFSTMVRIQAERDHKVAAEGPYKIVRHPGYIGFILMVLATPLVLGSLYALSMSVISSILFVIRTALEDKTLHEELKGYKEYAECVTYKLIPFIW